jgi:hypothetical protein
LLLIGFIPAGHFQSNPYKKERRKKGYGTERKKTVFDPIVFLSGKNERR